MTTEVERIKKLIKNHWDGPMWYGTNLSEVLKDITWQQAFNKPTGFSHNIYEYIYHMHAWRNFVVEYLNGNNTYALEMNTEGDWPTQYEASEESWNKILVKLKTTQEQLLLGLDKVSDEQIDEIVTNKKFRWYAFLHGVLHHDIYHSAQISLLKKLH